MMTLSAKAEKAAFRQATERPAAIARALAMQPTIMRFDEPTSALDPELVARYSPVSVSSPPNTHEIGFAYELADRMVFMGQGVVAASGVPRQLLLSSANPRFAAFVRRFTEQARASRPPHFAGGRTFNHISSIGQ